MTDQNNVAQPAIVVTLTRTLGAHGAAFDPPGPHRAFTYDHQPGNVGAHRLGAAWQKAASGGSGDHIDRGLELLQALQEAGFGVFEVSEIAAPVADERAEFEHWLLHDGDTAPIGYCATELTLARAAWDERARRAGLACAPAAGEAVGVVLPNGDTFRLSQPLPEGTKVYAAPQASADDVRSAALEEAAKLMDQTLRSSGAALIRGLKRPKADEDAACLHPRAYRAVDRNGYACPDCGVFVSEVDIYRSRAERRSSATKTGQGERDA